MLVTVCVYVILGLLAMIVYYRIERARMLELAEKIPGPKGFPFIGNAFDLGTTSTEFYRNVAEICKKWGQTTRLWIGPKLFVMLNNPKDIEILLGSTTVLEKASDYDFLKPWLGNGLLTSSVTKWRKHRKILTPTFHFKILEQFVDVFNANGDILARQLSREINGPSFDVYKYITLSALDNICESAMGVRLNAQINSESEYVKTVRNMSEIVMQRGFTLLLRVDFFFHLSSLGRRHDKYLKTLHDTTTQVIKERKRELLLAKGKEAKSSPGEDEGCGVKKRLAFLDLLLEASMSGENDMTDEDIREEVDTFMFEGHDTTSSGISFTLWLLAQHQDIQDRAFSEVREVLTGALRFQDLQAMKYLERVIKEALRLYPSVPFYGRETQAELTLHDGLILPKGSTATVAAYIAHMDPEIFPDPEKFDPDRFLPENVQGRHPYAYVPFSAGSRNCIGQKFAMIELKCTIAHVLSRYRLLPGEGTRLQLAGELILKSKTGIHLKIVPRDVISSL